MDDNTLKRIDDLENEARNLRAQCDNYSGRLHLLQSMMAEAGFPMRIKLGEDLHGNEDWVRVRPEVQLKDVLTEIRVHRGEVVG